MEGVVKWAYSDTSGQGYAPTPVPVRATRAFYHHNNDTQERVICKKEGHREKQKKENRGNKKYTGGSYVNISAKGTWYITSILTKNTEIANIQ